MDRYDIIQAMKDEDVTKEEIEGYKDQERIEQEARNNTLPAN